MFNIPESVFNIPGIRVQLRSESVFKILRNTQMGWVWHQVWHLVWHTHPPAGGGRSRPYVSLREGSPARARAGRSATPSGPIRDALLRAFLVIGDISAACAWTWPGVFPKADPVAVLVRYHTPNVYAAVVAWYYVAPGVAVFLIGQFLISTSRIWFARMGVSLGLRSHLDDRRVDPFKIWLDALPPWDGESRLDVWLGHVFTVGDIHEDLLSWASRSVLMGVVLRTDHPGEKHDEMVVLVGPQGTGKSTAWAWLLSGEPQRAAWFSDGLSFHDDSKTKAEALQGMVLVEASEMTGSTKAEVETIKKFLSRSNDNIRLTYRRDPSPLVRRGMIVGTTTDPRCLPNDPSGNRRFVSVPCAAGDPAATLAYLDEHRDQMWAEATHRCRELHETAYLPDSLKYQQAELTERYRAVDEVAEGVIGVWLAERPRPVTANEIGTGISWTPDSRSIYRITTVLKQLGYTRAKRIGAAGTRQWIWTLPDGGSQLEF